VLVRKSNYALRLQPSLMDELRKVAAEDQTTINQLINVAVAEKLAVLRSRRWFEVRAARGDPKKGTPGPLPSRPRPATAPGRRAGRARRIAPRRGSR
jgi:hypothetical protein